MKYVVIGESTRMLLIGVAAAAAISCGTAVYDHPITIVPVPPPDQLTVSVFDHQGGISEEWALQRAGVAEAAKPYRGTVTTMPVVTLTNANQARPVTVAFAIPDVTHDGYFLFTVDHELQNEEVAAAFCRYGEYFPAADAAKIPIGVTAHAAKAIWTTELRLDLGKIKTAFAK